MAAQEKQFYYVREDIKINVFSAPIYSYHIFVSEEGRQKFIDNYKSISDVREIGKSGDCFILNDQIIPDDVEE